MYQVLDLMYVNEMTFWSCPQCMCKMVEKTFTKFSDYNKRLYCDKCQDSCQPTNHLLKYKLSMKVCDLTSRLIYRLTVFGKSLESVIGCSAHHYKQIEELNQDKMAAKKIYHMLLHCLLGKLFNVNITKRFGMNTTLPTMYGKDFMVQGFDSEQTLIKQLQSHFDVGITDFNTKLKFGNQVNNCSRLPYTSSNYGATFTLCSDTRTMSNTANSFTHTNTHTNYSTMHASCSIEQATREIVATVSTSSVVISSSTTCMSYINPISTSSENHTKSVTTMSTSSSSGDTTSSISTETSNNLDVWHESLLQEFNESLIIENSVSPQKQPTVLTVKRVRELGSLDNTPSAPVRFKARIDKSYMPKVPYILPTVCSSIDSADVQVTLLDETLKDCSLNEDVLTLTSTPFLPKRNTPSSKLDPSRDLFLDSGESSIGDSAHKSEITLRTLCD